VVVGGREGLPGGCLPGPLWLSCHHQHRHCVWWFRHHCCMLRRPYRCHVMLSPLPPLPCPHCCLISAVALSPPLPHPCHCLTSAIASSPPLPHLPLPHPPLPHPPCYHVAAVVVMSTPPSASSGQCRPYRQGLAAGIHPSSWQSSCD
jgi:hypothetical protein